MRHIWWIFPALIAAWAITAYLVMPLWWERYAKSHPGLDGIPGITETTAGIPGDPVNVALLGTEEQVRAIFAAAGWRVAAPLSVSNDVRIAADSVLDRPDPNAPVSTLLLFGRSQDLAFEQTAAASPRERHHVRFWRAPKDDASGAPIWIGAASYDRSVGLSRDTGQITHHIAPDVDTERDHVIATLKATGQLSTVIPVIGFHAKRSGLNGGGDPWRTDGTLILAVIGQTGAH
ncbi:MAG: hypothetical protein C0519_10590 [Hyphomicrobium sp.]|jgi:hypothetical protein|nr:hypothetical protein [Hyphomicrobium sp.]PPD08410.1 MAG: hypothetical protein CTY28_05455 [Hyphomicrobium sp.]